jgi:hypothetical protein
MYLYYFSILKKDLFQTRLFFFFFKIYRWICRAYKFFIINLKIIWIDGVEQELKKEKEKQHFSSKKTPNELVFLKYNQHVFLGHEWAGEQRLAWKAIVGGGGEPWLHFTPFLLSYVCSP